MTVRAVRTLPDGEHAESREAPLGAGWFGIAAEPEPARTLNLGDGVTVMLDTVGNVLAVGYRHGKVTDSVLFHVLRSVQFQ